MDFTRWLGSCPIPNIFQGDHIVDCQSSYERDPNGAGGFGNGIFSMENREHLPKNLQSDQVVYCR